MRISRRLPYTSPDVLLRRGDSPALGDKTFRHQVKNLVWVKSLNLWDIQNQLFSIFSQMFQAMNISIEHQMRSYKSENILVYHLILLKRVKSFWSLSFEQKEQKKIYFWSFQITETIRPRLVNNNYRVLQFKGILVSAKTPFRKKNTWNKNIHLCLK